MKPPTALEIITACMTAGFLSVSMWPDNILAAALAGVPIGIALVYLIYKLKNDPRRFQ